ncbi:T9SS type A sorting domain-containing protein [Marivirga arenosa]|uniref:T9SS type A sorting domain-containing protein n=1 Tax=Marivirga arenosa TaxID=3059076 RepID=A0AA51ZXD2_9BACT|nr:T9SS type A sorting domain-containing protein [Marivirga sp. BKB1-2]WNB18466.1 T9SS type A sorting domain-containing protein [Marivirga sp. BKB1-2]
MRSIFFTVFCFLTVLSFQAQSQILPSRNCAAQTIHNQKLLSNPTYKNRFLTIQKQTEEFLLSRRFSRTTQNNTYREIPVYVHVIYDQDSLDQNISNEQIASQIAVINEDFRALNSDTVNVPAEFKNLVTDYRLTFRLEGISRKASTVTAWNTNDEMKSSSSGGVDAITPETHLNIWVVPLVGDILGYAQFPGGDYATDGIVVSPYYFGSSDYDNNNDFYLGAPFDKGRTTTHEIGHYLNLFHIWGDGGCSVDDEVEDTPIAGSSNVGCPSYPSKSCSENTTSTSDMFMNYMDYVDDDCMNMFTEGQKLRSQALFETGGFRENLGQVYEDCTLAPPLEISLVNRTETSLNISWDTNPEASSYEVWYNGFTVTTELNSIELVDLIAGQNYEIRIASICSDGAKGEYSDVFNFNTLGCYVGPLQFVLNTDDFGSETTWELSLNGEIVQKDSITYNDNTEYIESFDFGDGNYEFTIYDSQDDGICCQFGTGSFTLTDSNGAEILTGSDFGSSLSASFCVEQSPQIDCDNASVASFGINTLASSPAIYEFTAPEEREYIISSVGYTTVNTDLKLYRDCNSIIAENDDFGGLQSELRITLSQNQTIYIVWDDTYSTSGFEWEISNGRDTQTINFPDLESKKVNDLDFALNATASSGLEISYTSSNHAVATIQGDIVTITGAGQTTLSASQAGNDSFLAAPVVNKILTVNKLSQTITINTIPDKLTTDADFVVIASTTSELPLRYEISGPASIRDSIVALSGIPGDVTVRVTQDGNDEYKANTATISFQVIKDPCEDFTFENIIVENISCYNANDGSIEVNLIEGIKPYRYILNSGTAVETNLFEGLKAGEYIITALDAQDCSISDTVIIQNPEPLQLSAKIIETEGFLDNGSIELSVAGGTGEYNIEWSNGATTALNDNIPVGTYSVIVTDENACSIEGTYEVRSLTVLKEVKDTEYLVYPNPVFQNLKIFHTGNSNQIYLYDLNGKLILEAPIQNKITTINVQHLRSGLYFIRLEGNNEIKRFVKE